MRMRLFTRVACLLPALLLLPLLLLLTACSDSEKESNATGDTPVSYAVSPTTVSPVPLPSQPGAVKDVTVEIADGLFGGDSVALPAGEDTTLTLRNQDNVQYTVQIGDLVPSTTLPASTTTRIELKTPDSGDLEAQLFAISQDQPLDTLRITLTTTGTPTS